jgi:hypothetical protein
MKFTFLRYGYFVNTVSKFGDETSISKYVRDQEIEKESRTWHQSVTKQKTPTRHLCKCFIFK